MTDSPTPAEPDHVDPDVELASAHLDGEVGADERGPVDDPAVQAHLAAFAAVSEQVRDVPPAPDGLLDDHVAAAMAAFDDDGRVVAMAPRRTQPPWWQRIPLGAVAAALVVVALVGAIGLASQAGDDDSDDTATAALESTDDSGDDRAGGGGFSDSAGDAGDAMDEGAMEENTMESAPSAGSTTAGRPAFDSVDALADDLRRELDAAAPDEGGDGQATTTSPGSQRTDDDLGSDEAGDPCGAVELLELDPSDVVLVRSVVLTPDEVTAVVHDTDDGRRLTVVDDATCTVTFDRPL